MTSDPPFAIRTPGVMASVLALILALLLAAQAMLDATAGGALERASGTACIAIVFGLLGGFQALRRRLAPASLLALPTLLLLDVAVAAQAALAIPEEMVLRTIGRPPFFIFFLGGGLGLLAFLKPILVGRGFHPAQAGLILLLPLLSLEGLPLGTPPALGMGVAGILLLLSSVGQSRSRLPLLLPVSVLLVSFSLSTAIGADPGPGVNMMVRLLTLSGAFMLLGADPKPQSGVRLGLLTLLFTLIGVSCAALAAKFVSHYTLSELGIDSFGTELSLFGRHPNLVASWFGAGTVLSLQLALHAHGLVRSAARIAVILSATCLLLTASRLAIGATLLTCLIPLVFKVKFSRSMIRVGIALFVISLAAFALPALRDKVGNSAQHENTITESHRLHRMTVALDTGLEHPWLGQGPLCWFRQGAFTPPSRFDGLSTADHPHNIVLALFESVGILGLAAFIFLLVSGFRTARLSLASNDPVVSTYSLAITLALVCQLLTNLMDAGDSLETLIPSRLLIDLGLLAALARMARPEQAGGTAIHPPARFIIGAGLFIISLPMLAGTLLLHYGAKLGREGRPKEAISLIRQGSTLLPHDIAARKLLAGVAFASRDVGEARVALGEALDIAPLRPDVHETRAGFLLGLGQVEAALKSAQRAYELDPHGTIGAKVTPTVARLRLAIGDEENALGALASAVRTDFSILEQYTVEGRNDILKIGDSEIEIARLLAHLEDDIDDNSSDRLRRRVPLRECDILTLVGDHDGARAALEKMREIDGRDTVSYHQFQARTALSEGNTEAALEANRRAQDLIDNPILMGDEGDILRAMGEPARAAISYRRGLSLSHDVHFSQDTYRSLLNRLQETLEELGQNEERSEILDKLIFFTSDDLDRAELLAARGAVLLEGGQNEDARSCVLRALNLTLSSSIQPRSREIARTLGRMAASLLDETTPPSVFADSFEVYAQQKGAGDLLHEFRLNLLEKLNLSERARDPRQRLGRRSP